MEVKTLINNLFEYLKEVDSTFVAPTYVVNDAVSELETTYGPLILKVLQKDETFFSEPRLFCGVNLSTFVTEPTKETIWKHLQSCIFGAFLDGDLKDKLGKILETVKGIWNSSGQENNEITRILNDDSSQSHIQEIIEFLSETRIAKLCMKLFEEIDFEDMASELNIQDPNDIIEMMKNPENPAMKRIVGRIQKTLQEKMQRGEFNQQQIVSEVEAIKAKIQSLFGNVFNEMLGGRRADVPATVLMGNTPEARRQRMLARLQKKQREKNSR
jgi:hypothetical protein